MELAGHTRGTGLGLHGIDGTLDEVAPVHALDAHRSPHPDPVPGANADVEGRPRRRPIQLVATKERPEVAGERPVQPAVDLGRQA